jgi:hypothetical protein
MPVGVSTVIHGTLLTAVHGQFELLVLTLKDALPPPEPGERAVGAIE